MLLTCLASFLFWGGIAVATNETFVVNSTADTGDATPDGACDDGNGKCTLREAIDEANSTTGATIQFNIPQSEVNASTGTFTISSASRLEITSNGTAVDGTSQTAVNDSNANGPEIILRGAALGDGIKISAANCTIKGLILQNFNEAIDISGTGATGNKIQGCYIGTNHDGTTPSANSYGIFVGSNATNNTIGGTGPGEGNILSGNTFSAVWLESNDNFVYGNLIGLQRNGTSSLRNGGDGGLLITGDNNTVGSATGGNVLAGNVRDIYLSGNNNTIQGNRIGTNASGTAIISGQVAQDGINIVYGATGNLIGGTTAGAGNVMVGSFAGVHIYQANGNTIQGNFIGVAANGTTDLGNSARGVMLQAGSSNNVIGGTGIGEGNTIAFNEIGVAVYSNNAGICVGNSIRGNAIYSNTNLGIDLIATNGSFSGGLTANDEGDPDGGSNNLQNMPVITGISDNSGVKTITGTLNSTPGTTFALDFYAGTVADSNGFGEGQQYIGSRDGLNEITTDNNGNASFSFTTSGSVAGPFFTSTATRTKATDLTGALGDTSEFSNALSAQQGALSVSVSPSVFSEDGGNGVAMGTVTRLGSSGTSNPLTVNLSSVTPVSVQTQVVIQANQTSATFPVNVTNDSSANGTRTVTITAAAGGFTSGQTTVSVVDDDNPTLNVILTPNSLTESAAATASATVTRQGSLVGPLTVALSSSPVGNVTLPAQITIPAGATSAAFSIQVVDDSIAEGTHVVTITASAAGYPARNATLTLNDNDTPLLTISANPTLFSEKGGATASTVTVTRNTLTNGDLTVALASALPSRVSVPASVVIPAGSTSVSSSVAAIDDEVANGIAGVVLTARASGLPEVTTTVTINDDETPSLSLTLPDGAAVTEGGYLFPRVTHNLPPGQPLEVTLTSSAADMNVPASATIGYGVNSTLFSANAVEDLVAQGSRSVTLRASAPGLNPAEITVTINDNDTATLVLTIESTTLVEGSSATATVTRNTPISVPVDVALSSNTARIALPTTVTIPAGSEKATFTFEVPDNKVVDDIGETIFTASIPGFRSASLTLNVLDVERLTPISPCLDTTVLLGARKTTVFPLTVVAAPNLWISLQAREEGFYFAAELRLNGTAVPMRNVAPVGVGSQLFHVANPTAGAYTLAVTSQADTDRPVVVRACSDLPQVKFGQPTLRQVQHKYGSDWLQMDVPSGVSSVDLDFSSVAYAQFTVYKGGFDSQPIKSTSGDGEIKLLLSDLQPGRYYIRVDSSQILTGSSQVRDYSVLATATLATAAPRPSGITPNRGGNTGSVRVTINGGNLDATAKVKLSRSGVPDILGADVAPGHEGSLRATFDLAGRAAGIYNLTVTNADGRTLNLPNAFTVESGGSANVWVELVARTRIRIAREQSFFVNYGNRGNVDAYAVPLWIAGIPRNATVKFGFDLASLPNTPGVDISEISTISPVGIDGNEQFVPLIIPRIPAGSSDSLRMIITVPDSTPFTLRTWMNPPLVERLQAQTQALSRDRVTTRAVMSHGLSVQCMGDLMGVVMGIGGVVGGGNCLMTAGGFILGTAGLTADITNGDTFRVPISGMQWMGAGAKLALDCAYGLSPLGRAASGANAILAAIKAGRSCAGTGDNEGEGESAFGPTVSPGSSAITPVGAYDPNDKVGPRGHGTPRYISGLEPMPYTIFFENKSTATAPAEQVLITDQLDPTKFDLNSFTLGTITFGSIAVTPPMGLSEWTTDVDLRPSKPTIVRYYATVDKKTGVATFRFNSLDPETGLPHEDPDAGFLPPNKISTEGQGSVSFVIRAKTLPVNTVIRNKARIYFDENPFIDTPEWTNTVEYTRPSSRVLALPALQNVATFPVRWSGTDTGSGIQRYTIYVSENNGAYKVWQSQVTKTTANFTGRGGRNYRFYSVAEDGAGNIEETPLVPDATTTLASVDMAVTLSDTPDPMRIKTRLSYTLNVTNHGPHAATGVVATHTLPRGVAYVSASPSQGRATQLNGVVTATIGNMARGATVRVAVIVTPPLGAMLSSTASVRAVQPDPLSSNNSVTQSTLVAPYVTFTTPVQGDSFKTLPVVDGMAYAIPGGQGIDRVELFLRRNSDGKFWTGTAWGTRTALQTSLTSSTNGTKWSRTHSTATPLPQGTNLLDGLYTFTAVLLDKTGDTSTANATVHVDKVSPVSVAFVRPLNNAMLSSLTTIVGTASDDSRGAGIGRVGISIQRVLDRRYWNGTAWVTATVPPALNASLTATGYLPRSNWTLNAGLPTGRNLTSGQYLVMATAYDRSGSAGKPVVSRVTVDATAPTVSFTTPAPNAKVQTLPSISGRVTDNPGGSGIAKLEVLLRASNGKYWTGRAWGARTLLPATLGNGIWIRNTLLPTGANLVEGEYVLQAHGYDRVGNRTIAVNRFTVAPPVASVVTNSTPAPTVRRSSVTLSSIGLRVADSSLVLSFSGGLDADTATDAARYVVEINGEATVVEGVSLHGSTVTLALPEGAFRVGDRVSVHWNELLDSRGFAITGSAGPLTAR
jgi:uncharacterized repeat protein (TIGR01451 family)/CSLREA domain-containing protein